MREKAVCPPDFRAELKEPRVELWLKIGDQPCTDITINGQETRYLFDAFVGALYVEHGYSSVQAWIRPLIDPNSAPSTSGTTSHMGAFGNPPPPASPPPPLPHNSAAPGAPKSVYLSMFNQTAAQRGVKIEWTAVQSGPGHALTWNVECLGEYG
jgi:hypothetical protein